MFQLDFKTRFLQQITHNAPYQQQSSAFLVCKNDKEASMVNSLDPDQTAPIGSVLL